MKINKQYIENIPYVQEKLLKPVSGTRFMEALEKTYGADKTHEAIKFLLNQRDTAFSGMKEFKERLISGISDMSKISVDDQKYIVNIFQRIAAGIIKLH